MSAPPVEAWVFDLDGTLVDSRARLYGAYVQVAGAAGVGVLSPRELRSAIERRSLEQELGLGPPQAAALLEHWYEAFIDNAPASPAFAGAGDALRACSRHGARVAIATARPTPASVVLAELAEVGLASLVDVVTTTDTVGGPAPSPADGTLLSGYLAKTRQIRAALDQLGVDAGQAAMVSDEPSDLREAADLGVTRLVGVESGGTPLSAFRVPGAALLSSVASLGEALAVPGWPERLAGATSPRARPTARGGSLRGRAGSPALEK